MTTTNGRPSLAADLAIAHQLADRYLTGAQFLEEEAERLSADGKTVHVRVVPFKL